MRAGADDEKWMQLALDLARQAETQGEVPVGAVLVKNGELIGQGCNSPIGQHDPSAHAEIQAMRNAGQALSNYRLVDTTLYVTLEPCTMCAGAMIHARVSRLVYGACDPKTGAIASTSQILDQPMHNHKIEYQGGVLEQECSTLLKKFFARKRKG